MKHIFLYVKRFQIPNNCQALLGRHLQRFFPDSGTIQTAGGFQGSKPIT
jgi:hypothetical protein